MQLIPAKTPEIIKRLFSAYTWDIKTDNKELYLTFDDGPTPDVTMWVLDMLDQFDAKATFFCIGKNVQLYPKIYNEIGLRGHSIGNHTHNHIKGWKTSTKTYLEDINKASVYIESDFFRPPYGKLTITQGKKLLKKKYAIIMWDVVAKDWDHSISPDRCLQNVITNSGPGSIIVFHDSYKAEKNMSYALPRVLDYFKERGFKFKSL